MIKPSKIPAPFFIVLLLIAHTQNIRADEKPRSEQQFSVFDVPGQALHISLIEFALQAEVTIIADQSLLKGHKSSPVVGPQYTGTALERLLSSSPLLHYYDEETDTYVIFQSKASDDVLLDEELEEIPRNARGIDEILVTGKYYPFRYSTISNTQLHSSVAYYDSSRFFNVLPQSLIEDLQPDDIGDLVKHASGITPGDGRVDTNDDMYIRGFRRHALYVDGFRLGESTGIKIPTVSVRQAELVKGPSTLRYGQAEPGGIINIVRKKARAESFVNARVAAGSFGRSELELDVNEKLPFGSNAHYRLILSQESQQELGDVKDLSKPFASLSSAWQVTANTAFDVTYEYKKASQTLDRDIPILLAYETEFSGARLSDVARQARPEFSASSDFFSAELNHYLSPEWHLSAAYFWHDEERKGVRNTAEAMLESDLFFTPGEWGNDYFVLIPGGQIVLPILLDPVLPETIYSIGNIRNIYDEQALDTTNNLRFKLEGSFEFSGMEHRLGFGSDWQQQEIYKKYVIEERNPYAFQRWTESEFGFALADIANTLFDSERATGELYDEERHLKYEDFGIYLHDNIKINDTWIASLGTRYTSIHGTHSNFNSGVITELNEHQQFSSQLGLVYKPSENHSVYLNYSEALRANYHIDDVGAENAEPELSKQYEIGLKSHMLDGRMICSFALYDISKDNIVELSILRGSRRALRAYAQSVRGVEFDFSYQVSSKLDLMGAAAWMDPEINSGIYQGNTPEMAAESTLSAFANYRWKHNLEFVGGVKYVGERFGDNANQFYLGWYTTVDLGLKYKFKWEELKPSLRVSIKNAFDTEYFTAILGGVRTNIAQGRSINISLGASF